MFCDEPKCDCRRVFLYVVSSRGVDPEAVITYGWEARDFYANWLHDDDPLALDELQGPALNLGSPQSELAPAILDLARNLLLTDAAYVQRVKDHYTIFRESVDGKRKSSSGSKKRKKKRRKTGRKA
jgi:hypothetical protein